MVPLLDHISLMKIYQAIGVLLNIRNTMWFQHDGYPAHNAISM
jgi:hypothetical protein